MTGVDPQRPEPRVIAIVTVESVHGYLPTRYLGLIEDVGSTAGEAIQALENKALQRAAERIADPHSTNDGHLYAVLGMRITAGITAAGEPEWVAYGTLTSGHPMQSP
jgi:hypothetical protein